MVNKSKMLVSTNKKETIKIPTTLSSQNYIAQILFLTTTYNRYRLTFLAFLYAKASITSSIT